MSKFIKIGNDTIVNINEIITIDIEYQDAPDWQIERYAEKEGITKEEARESGEVFKKVYYIKLTNGSTLKATYINGNSPELDELLSLLNELNA